MNSQRIYLDFAATTPMRAEVVSAIEERANQWNFNPSSLHAEGRRARAALDEARERIAVLIGASRNEIIFTSGGTEADNLALFGTVRAAAGPAHVVASAIEHHAVLAVLDRLREQGVEVTLLPVNAEGRVDSAAFERGLRPQTVLASVMYANNEVGTIQPIAELAAIARGRGLLFHTDAVAAGMWLPLDVTQLGVDLLSLSAHKLYGPKGIGLLYVRRGVPLLPMLAGGGQEGGRRPGTENLAAIVGFVRALELAAAEREQATPRVQALRDRLEAGIRRLPGARINGGAGPRLPNLCNATFAGWNAGELMMALDLAGVAVSAGSACTSGAVEPSHVLAAMAPGEGRSGLRFSLGVSTTVEEIERVLAALADVIAGGMGRLETNRARLEAEA